MTRAIVFVGGELCDISRLIISAEDIIIGVDSGCAHALRFGLTPAIAIGDFDSLPAATKVELERRKVPLKIYPVDKDFTDLELALEHCRDLNVSEIVLTCALGGRLDMLLTNVMILTRPEFAKIRCSLVDGPTLAKIAFATPSQLSHVEFTTTPGDTISLVALSPQVEGVTIKGTHWLLNDHTLTLNGALAVSNRAVETVVTVSHRAGVLLVIHTLKA